METITANWLSITGAYILINFLIIIPASIALIPYIWEWVKKKEMTGPMASFLFVALELVFTIVYFAVVTCWKKSGAEIWHTLCTWLVWIVIYVFIMLAIILVNEKIYNSSWLNQAKEDGEPSMEAIKEMYKTTTITCTVVTVIYIAGFIFLGKAGNKNEPPRAQSTGYRRKGMPAGGIHPRSKTAGN